MGIRIRTCWRAWPSAEPSVLRTDRDGLVSIRSDGRRLYVDTGRQQAPARPAYTGLF